MVMEAGQHKLYDGTIVEAGNQKMTTNKYLIYFQGKFDEPPMVFCKIISNYDNTRYGTLKPLVYEKNLTYFEVYIKGNCANCMTALGEIEISWIAWSKSKYSNVNFKAFSQQQTLQDNWVSIEWRIENAQVGTELFAQAFSHADVNPTFIRSKTLHNDSVKIKLQKEDNTVKQITVQYLAIQIDHSYLMVPYVKNFKGTPLDTTDPNNPGNSNNPNNQNSNGKTNSNITGQNQEKDMEFNYPLLIIVVLSVLLVISICFQLLNKRQQQRKEQDNSHSDKKENQKGQEDLTDEQIQQQRDAELQMVDMEKQRTLGQDELDAIEMSQQIEPQPHLQHQLIQSQNIDGNQEYKHNPFQETENIYYSQQFSQNNRQNSLVGSQPVYDDRHNSNVYDHGNQESFQEEYQDNGNYFNEEARMSQIKREQVIRQSDIFFKKGDSNQSHESLR